MFLRYDAGGKVCGSSAHTSLSLNGAESPTRADKAEWAGASATGLSARGAEPTHEASTEPNLFELCLARRRKTIVKSLWRDSDTVSAAGIDD